MSDSDDPSPPDLSRLWGRHLVGVATRAAPAGLLITLLVWGLGGVAFFQAALGAALIALLWIGPATLIEREGLRRQLAPAWGALLCYLTELVCVLFSIGQSRYLRTLSEGGEVGEAVSAGSQRAWELLLDPQAWQMLAVMPAPLALACAVQLAQPKLSTLFTAGCAGAVAFTVGGGVVALVLRGLGGDASLVGLAFAVAVAAVGLVLYYRVMDVVETRLAGEIELPAGPPQPARRRVGRWLVAAGIVALAVLGLRSVHSLAKRAQRPELASSLRQAREVLHRQAGRPEPAVSVWAVRALYEIHPAEAQAQISALQRHSQDPVVGKMVQGLLKRLLPPR